MYMLDTNIVSHLFRKNQLVIKKLNNIPPSKVCISSITQAELLYGVAKRNNKALKKLVNIFLNSIEIIDWSEKDARVYGELRAKMESKGHVMGSLDMLIAAHALSRKKTIVTNDNAFSMATGLLVEDWTKE